MMVLPHFRAVLDDTLKLWDMKTGKLIRTLSAPGGEVLSGVFMPDGHTALSGSEDGSLRVWNLTDGSITRTFTGHKAGVQSVAVSSDGATALSGSEDETLKLWNLNTGQGDSTLTGHTGPGQKPRAFRETERPGFRLATARCDCGIFPPGRK